VENFDMSVLKEFSLEGKVTLVTGASRGIGRATAIAFAQAGSDLILTSRKAEDLEKVANEIKAIGRKALVISAHLGKLEDIKIVADKSVSAYRKLDILINNAGTNPIFASFLETEERLWDTIMNVNMKGMFFLSQSIAKFMKENGGGNIVNVASTYSFRPGTDNAVYSISKAAVAMATKAMARELAPYKIRVNAIAPGYVRTHMLESGYAVRPESEAKHLSNVPMRTIGNPEDMVGTMIYLASDASRYVTGHTALVDGGQIYF
jgi:NAD(P)-dependent dehydrogenase (short-subunit alcohol dehydrogenase family)